MIHDPLQVVSVASGDGGSAMIELDEPAGHCSSVEQFLKAGGGLGHLCLDGGGLSRHIEASRAVGCTLVRVPLPAVAFNGRKIARITTLIGRFN